MHRRDLVRLAGWSAAAPVLGALPACAQRPPAGAGRPEAMLLVEKSSHCLSWYDLASGERLHSVALGPYPHECVVDAAQRYAYVSHYGLKNSDQPGPGGHSVFQVDLAARALARTIALPSFDRLHGVQLDESGRLYALSEDRAQLGVVERPETASAATHAVPVGGIKSHLFALTRDGQTAYAVNLLSNTVTRVKPYDATVAPVACMPGRKPEGNVLSADERTLYVACRLSNTLCAIDTATMQVVRRAATRDDPLRVYRRRDGRLLVAHLGDRSISLVDPASLAEIANVRMDARPSALSLHPVRPWALVSQDDDRVGILDLESMRFVRHFATQREPDVSMVLRG
jgi:YVTN family beta-propeller protein